MTNNLKLKLLFKFTAHFTKFILFIAIYILAYLKLDLSCVSLFGLGIILFSLLDIDFVTTYFQSHKDSIKDCITWIAVLTVLIGQACLRSGFFLLMTFIWFNFNSNILIVSLSVFYIVISASIIIVPPHVLNKIKDDL